MIMLSGGSTSACAPPQKITARPLSVTRDFDDLFSFLVKTPFLKESLVRHQRFLCQNCFNQSHNACLQPLSAPARVCARLPPRLRGFRSATDYDDNHRDTKYQDIVCI